MFCFASLDGARERSRSHPSRAFGAVSRRAKIPSPQPPSFLPVCWKPPTIFSDGGASNWVVGGVLVFQILLDSLAILVLLFTLEVYLNKINF